MCTRWGKPRTNGPIWQRFWTTISATCWLEMLRATVLKLPERRRHSKLGGFLFDVFPVKASKQQKSCTSWRYSCVWKVNPPGVLWQNCILYSHLGLRILYLWCVHNANSRDETTGPKSWCCWGRNGVISSQAWQSGTYSQLRPFIIDFGEKHACLVLPIIYSQHEICWTH